MDLKVIGVVVIVSLLVVAVVLMAVMIPRTGKFRANFMEKCKKFPAYSTKCEELLASFEKAYVGKRPYPFHEEDYDPVFVLAPFTHPGEKTMFWSGKGGGEWAHKFTENRDCLFTLENTLLGSVLDRQKWCGLKGLKGTYEPFCTLCRNNTVDSFWRRASMKFAQHAMGAVTAMLDGDGGTPYSPNSVFANIEIKQLFSPRVTKLDVILVTNKKGVCEKDTSLVVLKNIIRGKNIGYSCKEVPSAHIKTCIENSKCGSCWSEPFSGFETSEFILRTPYKITAFYFFVYIIYSSIHTY